MARKVGGATLIGISVGTSGLFTLLTPIAARTHPGVLIALRIVIGMTEVIDVPKLLTLLLFCLVVVVFHFFRSCPHLQQVYLDIAIGI